MAPRFEENRGQLDERVKFEARGQGYSLFLTAEGATLALHRHPTRGRGNALGAPGDAGRPLTVEQAALRMKIVGAREVSEPQGVDPQGGQVRYFIGNDPQRWQTSVASYARVRYPQVLPGIDLVYYGTGQRRLEYDLVVSPGADPRRIAFAFEGADNVAIDANGGLVLHVGDAEIHQRPPVAYQEGNGGAREVVASHYVRRAGGAIGFELGRYDRSRRLIIDPVMVYSTYVGGAGQDYGIGIAVDAAKNAYVVGQTFSTNFPTTPGAFQTVAASSDAFVTKLTPGGNSLAFSTYLGGSGTDYAWKCALDSSGNVYVAGSTDSTNFPITAGAFRTTNSGSVDVFVTKLTTSGSMSYSTYIGGAGVDEPWGIAVDSAGSVYVAGDSSSLNYPTTPGAYQTTFTGGLAPIVTKLTPSGAQLSYSTYIWGPVDGGTTIAGAYDVAIDGSGSAYITGYTNSPSFPTTPGAFRTTYSGGGSDAFVAKLNPTGSSLVYSTYLGGSGGENGRAIAVDFGGNAFVTGDTNSHDFTTVGAAQWVEGGGVDSFITKLNPAGSAMVFSTFLGGSGDDNVQDLAIDFTGRVTVVGSTVSSDYPITPDAVKSLKSGADNDVFLSTLNPAGDSLAFSTYLGGASDDLAYGVAEDSKYALYLTGTTVSLGYPTTTGAYQTANAGSNDVMVTKLSVFPAPAPAMSAVAGGTLAFLLTLGGAMVVRKRRTAGSSG